MPQHAHTHDATTHAPPLLCADPEGLELAVEDRDDCVVLRLRGELDLAQADAVEEAMRSAETHCRLLVLDLAGLRFIDSSGLAVAVRGYQRAQDNGHEFAVSGARHDVLRAFRLTALDVALPFAPDVATVLADGTTSARSQVSR